MAEVRKTSRQYQELQLTARRLLIDGELWLVYELPPTFFDRRQSSSLVFESDTAFRRVRNFAADWRKLPDDELAALSWTV